MMKFQMDFIKAEMVNLDSDETNQWKWKKGQSLHQWTKDKYYIIIKMEKYPSTTIHVKSAKTQNPLVGIGNNW